MALSAGTRLILAAPFDPTRLELTGAPIPVVDGVAVTGCGDAHFGLSRNGTLVYAPGAGPWADQPLVWVDREGRAQPISDLRLTAALAVHAGLPAPKALFALTQGGADALGVGAQVGSLEKGKQGDLVVLSGPPLDLGSRVLELYVAGRRVYRRPAPKENE